jgi:VWFA-related protein
MRGALSVGGVCAAVLVAGTPARAAQKRDPPALEFGASITLVTLPVFVTDGSGRAASGLTAADFEVQDDGRSMPIVGFREIDVGAPEAAQVVRQSPAARRQFLLLFDLSFTGVNGLVRSRRAAGEFIGRLGETDLAAVATFSANHGLQLLVGFTTDRGQLLRAVDTLGVTQLDRRADPLGLAFDLTDVGAAAADSLPEETGSVIGDAIRAVQLRFERSQEAQYRQRVMAFVDSLGALAQALSVVQGRKQVILLSNGFDDTALTGVQGQQAAQDAEAFMRGRVWEVQSDNRFGDSQVRTELSNAMRRFSMSDAVVHAIDLGGLSARGDARQQVAEPHRRTSRESLAEIASVSGGRLFKDTNDLGTAFGEVLEMSRRYYLVAFEPREARGGGRFHKLKVKVKRKGLHVSHRSGYFERSASAERTPLQRRFEAAEMVAKGMPGGDVPLRALVLPYGARDGGVSLPVVLEVRGRDLPPMDKGLGLEVYGYAYDATESMVDFAAAASNFDLARVGGRLQDRGLQVHTTFTLPPGKYSLRFLVRETTSGRAGATWLDVNVPAFDASEVLLLPPLFIDPPTEWVIVNAPARRTRSAPTPFTMGEEAFTPRARPLLVNGHDENVFLLAYDGGRRYDPGASFEIRPALLDADGVAVPTGRFQVVNTLAGEDGFRRFMLRFTPAGLAAGDYRLRVRLREPASGRITEAYQAVRVE